jgi:hypothetical protein
MNSVKVVINSIEDSEAGKRIIEDVKEEDVKETTDITVGILERGTESGKTTLMFCLKYPDGKISLAQMTGRNFEALHQIYLGAKERFEK